MLSLKQIRKHLCGNDHLILLSSMFDSTLLLAKLFPLCCLVDNQFAVSFELLLLSVRGRKKEVINMPINLKKLINRLIQV